MPRAIAHRLADDLEVSHPSRITDLRLIHREIFEDEIYLQHGISIEDDGCVFDVGANVGMFSLFLLRRRSGIRVFAFEPVPPTFAALQKNLAPYPKARLFDCALSDAPGLVEMKFYRNNAGSSTMRPELPFIGAGLMHEKLRSRRLPAWLANLIVGSVYRHEIAYAPTRTLSDVIEAEAVERIDLLKVDVEGAEPMVLRGIRDEHWPRIGQLVAEVHRGDERVAPLRSLLEERGFVVEIDGETLYAIRPDR